MKLISGFKWKRFTLDSGLDYSTKGFRIGDAVAGFVHGGVLDPDNGSFQGQCTSPSFKHGGQADAEVVQNI
jgi:hypothetical protein